MAGTSGADALITIGIHRTNSYSIIDKDIDAIRDHINKKKIKIQVGISDASKDHWATEIQNKLNNINGLRVVVPKVTLGPGALNTLKKEIAGLVKEISGGTAGVAFKDGATGSDDIKKRADDAKELRKQLEEILRLSAMGSKLRSLDNLSIKGGLTKEEDEQVRELTERYNELRNKKKEAFTSGATPDAAAQASLKEEADLLFQDIAAFKSAEQQAREYVSAAQSVASARSTWEKKLNAGNASQFGTTKKEFEEAQQAYQKLVELQKAIASGTKPANFDQEFRESITTLTQWSAAAQAAGEDTRAFANEESQLADRLSSIKSKLGSLDNLSLKNGATKEDLDQIQLLIDRYNALKAEKEKAFAAGSTPNESVISSLQDKADALLREANAFQTAEQKARAYASAVQEVSSAISTWSGKLNEWSASKNGSTKELYVKAQDALGTLNDLQGKLASGGTKPADFDQKMREALTTLNQWSAAAQAAGENTQSFGSRIANLGKQLVGMLSFQRIIGYVVRAIREMIKTTIELDNAFTQLRIVTGATKEEMRQFEASTVSLAKRLGQSVTDVAKSVETFSRLGYSLEDASQLAEYAGIMSNVAGVSADEATTGMTAIIKGYNKNVSESEHIADVLVNVGKKYAISAGELMEGFEKAGAALNATNTSFEKSAGLLAAANASVQNASTVGTALKTVSARIRGSKSELSELGEDIDELADGFSKYAKEIQALTGFNIMVEGTTDEFKDLYEIFDGMAAAWDKLSDTQRARVSEILGGTRQLQVISSIIGNWGDATNAYATAMDSAGEATRANNIWMESATAHINQFKATFQELSKNLIDSDLIKTVVDIGTFMLTIINALVKLINLMGGLKLVLVEVMVLLAVGKWKAIKSAILGVQAAFQLASEAGTTGIARLSTAFDALGVSASTAQIAIMGVFAVLSIVLIVVNSIQNAKNAAIAKTNEAAESAASLCNEISTLTTEYIALNDAVKSNNSSKEDLLSTQNELIDKLELEKKRIRELTKEYGTYENAILAASSEKLKELRRDLISGVNASEQNIEDFAIPEQRLKFEYGLNDTDNRALDVIINNPNLTKILDMFGGDKGVDISFTGDLKNPEDVIKYYEMLGDLLDAISDEGIALTKSDIYQSIYAQYSGMTEYVNQYKDAIGELNDNIISENYLNNVRESGKIPKTQKEFDAFRDSLISSTIASDEFIGNEEDAADAVDKYLSKQVQFVDFYNEYGESQSNASQTTKKTTKQILGDVQSLSAGLDQLDKIYADVTNGGDFDWGSILNNESFHEAFGGLNEAYDNFIERVSNAPNDIEACQEAFNDLASAYIRNKAALDDVTDAERVSTIAMLKQWGVANAEAIVDEQLAYNKEKLRIEEELCTDATIEGIYARWSEADAASYDAQVLYKLVLQKISLNNTKINNKDDVSKLLEIAKAAGAGVRNIQLLTEAEKKMGLAAEIEKKGLSGLWANKLRDEAAALVKQASEDFEVKLTPVNFTGVSTSNSSGGSSSSEKDTQLEAYENIASLLESELKLLEAQEAPEKDRIAKIKKIQDALKDQIIYMQRIGADQEEINKLSLEWLEYQKDIQEIYDDITENAKGAVDDLVDYRIKMLEQDLKNERDALKDRLDALKKFYDKQKDLLRDKYDEEKYLEEQAEKRKAVSDVQFQIEQLRYDNSAWAQKRRLELQQELTDAQKELDDFERDHAIEVTEDALDKMYEAQEDAINQRTDVIDAELDDERGLYMRAIEDIKHGGDELYQAMINWNDIYGDHIASTITSAWEEAYKALKAYKDLYGSDYEGVTISNATGYKAPTVTQPPGASTNITSSSASTAKSYPYGKASDTSGLIGVGYSNTKAQVQAVQYALNQLGYGNSGTTGLDGVFGTGTRNAVINFQRAMGILADGVVGKDTRSKFKAKGYYTGTENATPGMHRLFENGDEFIFKAVDGAKYKLFSGGEKVLNAKGTDFLYKFAEYGSKLFPNLSGAFPRIAGAGGFAPVVEMGDIIIQGNADNKTVSEIRRAQRDALSDMLKSLNRLNK